MEFIQKILEDNWEMEVETNKRKEMQKLGSYE
jgi:hypothetical protein